MSATIIPWSSSSLQNPLNEPPNNDDTVIDIQDATEVYAIVDPDNRPVDGFGNSWIYQLGLILMSMTSMTDIYILCNQSDEISCFAYGSTLTYNMIVSAACILIVAILYYYSYITAIEGFLASYWAKVAKYMMRTFLIAWIITGAMYIIGITRNQCNSGIYLYLQVSYVLKIGLMILEYTWVLSSCPV